MKEIELPDISDSTSKSKKQISRCTRCGLPTSWEITKLDNMGSDRGQLLRSLSPETAPVSGAGVIKAMLTPYSEEETRRFDPPERAAQMRSWLRNQGLSERYCLELFPTSESLPGTNMVTLGLQLFLFHPYNEKNIKATLVNDADWKLPGGDHLHAHHDCNLHATAMHFFREATGNTLTSGEIAVDAREGIITQQEVVDVLRIERQALDVMINPYANLEQLFGISEKTVHHSAKKFHRRVALFRRIRKLQLKVIRPRLDILTEENQ